MHTPALSEGLGCILKSGKKAYREKVGEEDQREIYHNNRIIYSFYGSYSCANSGLMAKTLIVGLCCWHQ